MSKSPGSCAAKRNAPFVSHMDGRQVTQQGSLTDRETGNASEKQDGNPSEKRKAGRSGLFFVITQPTVSLLGRSYLNGLSYISFEARSYPRLLFKSRIFA
jgi:hypothetical protein